MMFQTPRTQFFVLFLLCALTLSGLLSAQEKNNQADQRDLQAEQLAKTNPKELVRKAVQNEDKEPAQNLYFMFRNIKTKSSGIVETKQMIETPQMMLGRLVAINGKPLNAEQKKKEDDRLNRLINNPSEAAKKKKAQQEDDARARRMVSALPDAFNYQFVGTEQGNSGELIVLKFRPDPNYDPPSRELQVYTGMEGNMKIAVPQMRMALIQAKLFKGVDFGWGILGHLDPGGDFLIQQSEIYPPDHWDITHMKLHFTGKVLIFKSLNIQQNEENSDYHPVPSLTVSQALQKLDEMNNEYARNADGGGK